MILRITFFIIKENKFLNGVNLALQNGNTHTKDDIHLKINFIG